MHNPTVANGGYRRGITRRPLLLIAIAVALWACIFLASHCAALSPS